MFDEDFSFLIEQKYPYPVAVTFRRLETDEYVEPGPVRLKGVLETAERGVHLLALAVLINICEHFRASGPVELPKALTADFERKFAALSFGSMIYFMREGVHFLEERNALFVP